MAEIQNPKPIQTPTAPRALTIVTLTSPDGDDDDAIETFKIRMYRSVSTNSSGATDIHLSATSTGESADAYELMNVESEKQYSIDHEDECV